MLSKIIQKVNDKYHVDSVKFNFDLLKEKYYIVIFNKISNNHIDTSYIFISDSKIDLENRLNTIYIQGFENNCKEWRGTECQISVKET